MRSRTLVCGFLLLSLLVLPTTAAPPGTSPFLGNWQTEWERIDYPNCDRCTGHWAKVTLKITEDTRGIPDILDGEWTQPAANTNPETAAATGYMHGTLSGDHQTWTGVWWAAGPYAHGGFSIRFTGAHKFSGTFTAAKHGSDPATYEWNSPPDPHHFEIPK
jgi:hypothetical protein